jgi:ATP-dependent Lhr-like helicase
MLEQEGYVMRGHFLPGEEVLQWCERGLLARIHRRTIKHLRKQVQPASIAGFMRFLFHWHGIGADSDAELNGAGAELVGSESLAVVLDQLEGAEVPGAAWEAEVLPLRINGYRAHWLDGLCTNGAIRWARLSPPGKSGPAKSGPSRSGPANSDPSGKSPARVGTSSIRISPIALCRRRGIRHWLACSRQLPGADEISANARRILEILQDQGARFFDELVECGGWLKVEVENALSELVTVGMVTSDSFSGFRALASRSGQKSGYRSRQRARGHSMLDNAGRWSLLRGGQDEEDRWQTVEYIAQVLLKRYGIVFRKLLDLENNLPSWRELHYVYRRMEARGEVRGGRFVHGFSGEQFALPEAVGSLRRIDRERDDALVSISAADPLNLTGTILPGERVTAISKNRILFRNGTPMATLTADEVTWLEKITEQEQWAARQKLISVPMVKPEKYRHRRLSDYH